MALDIQSYFSGLSLSITVELLEDLGVHRSRKAISKWVQKDTKQPESDRSPNQIAFDETVIRINTQQYWQYVAVDRQTNGFLHIRLFATTATTLTQIFLHKLREKHDIDTAVFRFYGAQHNQTELHRSGLGFQICRYGNQNAVERFFQELKRRIWPFSN
jgi:putative transposase